MSPGAARAHSRAASLDLLPEDAASGPPPAMPITPAELAFTPEGIPYSAAFGDVYHTRSGGLGQARHVFLGGNGLPGRWQDRERFTVLETGFGLGLNFLATWQAWRADPQRCARLHFVSAELHPFRREDLARLHAEWPALADLSSELLALWPSLAPGVHRLHLDGGRVVLTLLFGDAEHFFGGLHCAADAIYLDGFSPACNPEMWQPRLLYRIARLAAPGATLATWSVAAALREGLQRAGFDWEKTPGFSGKREMLQARLRAPGRVLAAEPARHALILGAGVAGTSLAERLCARGWQVDLMDRAEGPAQGASGNIAGVLRPLPSLDDNRLARLTRAGALYARRHLEGLAAAGHPVRWGPTGVLHLARDAAQRDKMRRVVEVQQLPEDCLRFVAAEAAGALAGLVMPEGGWHFPGGGWVQPPSLCAANLTACGARLRTRFGREVARLAWQEGRWQALDAAGQCIAEAPVLVLANGTGVPLLAEGSLLPVRSARGQVSHAPAPAGDSPQVVVCRNGYLSPVVDGVHCFGATFQVGDPETALREEDHAENLAKLESLLPPSIRALPRAALGGRVGFRPVSPDRLPMVGAVPLPLAADAPRVLARLARQPGLYALTGFGARGLVWASLLAETLASRLHGDPMPLEDDLLEALDPARFLLRQRPPELDED